MYAKASQFFPRERVKLSRFNLSAKSRTMRTRRKSKDAFSSVAFSSGNFNDVKREELQSLHISPHATHMRTTIAALNRTMNFTALGLDRDSFPPLALNLPPHAVIASPISNCKITHISLANQYAVSVIFFLPEPGITV
jgi:hypothetical protein